MLSFRIRRWYVKLLYVVGVWLAGYLAVSLIDFGVPGDVAFAINDVLTLAGIVYGARIFRGADEPDEPARPWWQMTARRTLSRVIGFLAVFATFVMVVGLVGAALGQESFTRVVEQQTVTGTMISVVFYAVVAFLYLNSAARLPKPEPRNRPPKLPRPPKLT
ncbi:MAG: hypothetical protein RL499_1047 [Actinomycetota bacterium]|jgi:hypothetical protein